MNVAAGIAIGYFAASWYAMFLWPFVWAVLFCFLQFIGVRLGVGQAPHYMLHALEGATAGRVRSVAWAFYFPAYVSAAITALLVALLTAAVMAVFA